MKKSLAYVMAAVLLGAVIMILPFWVPTDTSTGFFTLSGGSEDKYAPSHRAAFGGLISPLGFVGLMLAISLILALGVYLFSKRRMPL